MKPAVKPADWVERRLRVAGSTDTALRKAFPTHWSFMFGEIALYAFLVLVATGVFLALFFESSDAETIYTGAYEPFRGLEVSRAYASSLALSFDVRAGLLVRQTHHWAALLFVGAIVVHLMRIFFTGAFRRPRELNWIVGVLLLGFAIFAGFTGYSLPDDLLSGAGLRIGWSILLAVPFIGDDLAFLIFGGDYPGTIVPRLLTFHTVVIPAAIATLIALHMAILIRQKHTQLPGRGRTEDAVVGEPLWPGYAMQSLALLFFVAGTAVMLGAFVQINPIWIYGPYQAAAITSPAQPDWYMMWIEGALRIFPPVEIGAFGYTVPSQFVPGLLMPTLTFAMLLAWPFLEARVTGDRQEHELAQRPRDRAGANAIGIAAATFYGVLVISANNHLIARFFDIPILDVTMGLRILAVALPPLAGIAGYRVLRALARTGARGPLQVPADALLGRSQRNRRQDSSH